MFIESFRQAHGQLKQQGNKGAPAHIIVSKEGNWHYLLGGAALTIGFFLPAIRAETISYAPYHALAMGAPLLKLLPLIYILGLTTTLLIGTGRFSKQGIPTHLLITHMILSVGIILGTGVLLHWGLVVQSKRFGVVLMPFALLFWWPLFITFVMAWVWKRSTFLAQMLDTTWISAACALLLFSIVLLDVYYYGTYKIAAGLLVSAAGAFLVMLGGIRNRSRHHKL